MVWALGAGGERLVSLRSSGELLAASFEERQKTRGKLQVARKIKGQSGRVRLRGGILWESACRRRFGRFACKHAPTMSRSRGLVFCGSGGSTAMGVTSDKERQRRR